MSHTPCRRVSRNSSATPRGEKVPGKVGPPPQGVRSDCMGESFGSTWFPSLRTLRLAPTLSSGQGAMTMARSFEGTCQNYSKKRGDCRCCMIWIPDFMIYLIVAHVPGLLVAVLGSVDGTC